MEKKGEASINRIFVDWKKWSKGGTVKNKERKRIWFVSLDANFV